MKTSMGVARNSPVLSTDELRNENGEICFVTTKTFEEIVPIIVDGRQIVYRKLLICLKL